LLGRLSDSLENSKLRTMARIKKTLKSGEYYKLRTSSNAFGEWNDCTVVATAAACGVTYAEAHAALASFGREKGRGLTTKAMLNAIKSLGKSVEFIPSKKFISLYPKGHRDVLKHVTTHHPERFNDVWADGKSYLIFTIDHVAAIVNGVNHDWTKSSAKRAREIYLVS
jgi:hypothetical protein